MNQEKNILDKVLSKARRKYSEAIRGKDYQEYLQSLCVYGSDDFENLQRRKSIYVQDIALLEDVFGSKLLQN